MTLTQKETDLLKDLTDQEKLCIDKYTEHAGSAKDPALKNLFTDIAAAERHHLEMLNAISTGTVPPVPGGSSPIESASFSAYHTAETEEKKKDCYLCTDVLAGEKHASHLYDACIFEFADKNVRSVLNSIQKQEQIHGKAIYDYMAVNGMY